MDVETQLRLGALEMVLGRLLAAVAVNDKAPAVWLNEQKAGLVDTIRSGIKVTGAEPEVVRSTLQRCVDRVFAAARAQAKFPPDGSLPPALKGAPNADERDAEGDLK